MRVGPLDALQVERREGEVVVTMLRRDPTRAGPAAVGALLRAAWFAAPLAVVLLVVALVAYSTFVAPEGATSSGPWWVGVLVVGIFLVWLGGGTVLQAGRAIALLWGRERITLRPDRLERRVLVGRRSWWREEVPRSRIDAVRADPAGLHLLREGEPLASWLPVAHEHDVEQAAAVVLEHLARHPAIDGAAPAERPQDPRLEVLETADETTIVLRGARWGRVAAVTLLFGGPFVVMAALLGRAALAGDGAAAFGALLSGGLATAVVAYAWRVVGPGTVTVRLRANQIVVERGGRVAASHRFRSVRTVETAQGVVVVRTDRGRVTLPTHRLADDEAREWTRRKVAHDLLQRAGRGTRVPAAANP